jgi:signal transduction histidine kinase
MYQAYFKDSMDEDVFIKMNLDACIDIAKICDNKEAAARGNADAALRAEINAVKDLGHQLAPALDDYTGLPETLAATLVKQTATEIEGGGRE